MNKDSKIYIELVLDRLELLLEAANHIEGKELAFQDLIKDVVRQCIEDLEAALANEG